MSALTKQLLLDYHRLPEDARINFCVAIQGLFKSRVLSRQDIITLDLYLQGYTAEEIALKQNGTTEEISAQLSRIVQAIEYASGTLDTSFIHRVAHKYTPRQLKRLEAFLGEHSKDFNTHD